MRLRYNPAKGWFAVIEFYSGTVDARTGVRIPDQYGCLTRRLIAGPYPSAPAAMLGQ